MKRALHDSYGEPVLAHFLKQRERMRKSTTKRRSRNRGAGFTMIEIMLVLALIGLIMGALVYRLRRSAMNGQVQIARVQVTQVSGSLFQQRLANGGDCPAAQDPTVGRTDEKDPWGHALVIVCPGERDQGGVDVASLGPDGKPSDDDIVSWRLK
jgi:general secretion pathway protein G